MTLEEFIDEWPGSSADERFAAFLLWIQTEVEPWPVIMERHASPTSGNPEFGFLVYSGLFTESHPDMAIAEGDLIIAIYQGGDIRISRRGDYSRWRELEKHLNKLLDKMRGKPKGDPGYWEWYYTYYLPKLRKLLSGGSL